MVPREGYAGDPWKPEGSNSWELNQFYTCTWDMWSCPWKTESTGAAWFGAEDVAQSPHPQPPLACASCRACPQIPLPGIVPTGEEVLSGLQQEAFFPQRVPAPLQDNILASTPPRQHWCYARDSGQGRCPGEGALEMPVPSRNTLSTSLGKLSSLPLLVSWGPLGYFFGGGLQLGEQGWVIWDTCEVSHPALVLEDSIPEMSAQVLSHGVTPRFGGSRVGSLGGCLINSYTQGSRAERDVSVHQAFHPLLAPELS